MIVRKVTQARRQLLWEEWVHLEHWIRFHNDTFSITAKACFSVSLSAGQLILRRHFESFILHQVSFPTSCTDVPPTSLILGIIQRSSLQPIVLTDFGDTVTRALVSELVSSENGSSLLVVDINKINDWTKVRQLVTKKRALLVLCAEKCVQDLLAKVRPQ